MAQRLEYILALDYGEKRVGVAIAHEIARLPRPLTTLHNTADLIARISTLASHEQAALIVVGLPRSMDGSYSAQTVAAEAFADQLRQAMPVPIILVDETLTSVDAEAALAGRHYDKGEVDALAACYILERYLQEQSLKEQSR